MGPRRPRSAERRAHPPATVRAQADLAQSTARFRGLRAADARDGGGASVLRRLPGGAQRRGARRPREAIGFPSPLAGAIKRRVSRVLNGLVPQGGPPRRGGPDGDGRLTFAMREVLNELNQWTREGEEIAVATVIETWGPSPRPPGHKMLVTRSGRMAGSVSNGCIEGAVFEEAQKVLKSGQPKIAAFGVADDVAFEVGLACGGHIEVFIQPFGRAQQQVLAMLNRDEPATLRTNLLTGDAEVVEGTPQGTELAKRQGDVFVEPFRRPAHLVIIGAIHIAIPLHRLARLMGYRVTVVDARAKFATKERFPEADELIVAWPDEAMAKITVDNSTYVVVLTHDSKFDLPALRSVLQKDAG